MTSAQHSKADPNWTTPPWLTDAARECLGGRIDLDPFSSYIANQNVGAARYFTQEQDGFAQEWTTDALFINPPGLMVKKAWAKLCAEIQAGRTQQAFWVGFSIEQLAIMSDPNLPGETASQRYSRGGYQPTDFSWVILRKRVSFVREDGSEGSPAHSNYLTAPGVAHERLEKHFGRFGRVIRGPLSISG